MATDRKGWWVYFVFNSRMMINGQMTLFCLLIFGKEDKIKF